MDRHDFAQRTASECVRGPGKKLCRDLILADLKILNFDFDDSEVEKASLH